MHKNKDSKIPRPPVVVVMGHIDHGKSTLLDYIRKTSTVESEAGGITQHIAAYEVEVELKEGSKKNLVFIDTPGHEAFDKTRERGSRVADVAILVVSAEDGVKPQTVEAIKWIKREEMPFVVAINKIDKPNANLEKTKQGLAENEVLLEGWGGNVPLVAISAKTGEGVHDLLEIIVLQAELEGLLADLRVPASGFVLESHRDPQKGISATLIIKDGTLRKGTYISAGDSMTPVRAIESYDQKQLEEAGPSKPIVITGWDKIPRAGDLFKNYSSRSVAEDAANDFYLSLTENKKEDKKEQTGKIVPVAIKADTTGSLEAINHELEKLNSDKISTKAVISGIGTLSEGDLKPLPPGKAGLILAFNVKIDGGARDYALRNSMEIKSFNVIYELVEWLEEKLKELTPQEEVLEVSGRAKILKLFSKNKNKQILGGTVEEGIIENDSLVKISRREAEIGEGRVRELQSHKVKTSSVNEGNEFGMLIDSKVEIMPGDRIICVRKVIR